MIQLDTGAPAIDAPPAAWYRALTLRERIAAGRGPRSGSREGAALAERRLRRWRSQPPFADDALFSMRLALDQIDEERFRLLLGEPPEALRDRVAMPAWLAELLEAFERHDAAEPILPKLRLERQTAGFLNLAAPLIVRARERLRAGIRALRQGPAGPSFDPDTLERLLFAALPGQIIPIIGRTLVLELHIARLQGLLLGDTPEERFQHFVERLREPGRALAILEEYPVLARALASCVDQWALVSLELLQRLRDDWAAIRATFAGGADPGALVGLDGGDGDQHRGGRSVVVASFSSGLRVVYKPRSTAVDLHFQELLGWLNQRGGHPPFRTLKVLDRGTHGWVEFVDAAGCASPGEVRRFYERQGAYLALLYALESTDFHFENLIAAGEHPVLIDLEALFHPRLGEAAPQPGAGPAEQYSVLRVGLLPWRVGARDEAEGIDIGGLGSIDGQLTPDAFLGWEGEGTDGMRLTRKRLRLAGGRNRPTLGGGGVNVLDYAGEIEAGFTAMYRLLQAHRDELLAPDGPLARFADDEVRVIPRPTRTYAILLQESYHPDVLRDALDRERLLDRLWAGVERDSALARLIPAERAELYGGDIPLFTTTPGSRDLWNSAQGRIADALAEPGMASVRRRVQQLSDADLERQRWLVRASLATLAVGEGAARQTRNLPAAGQAGASREALLRAARAVGDRLEQLAIRGAEDATWLGLVLGSNERWSLAPLGADLYSGVAGVALFLGYLGSLTGEARYTALARAALTTLRGQVAAEAAPVSSIGAFDGWGGIIYALAHLGSLWGEPGLREEAEALVGRIPNLLARDDRFDIIGGAAGCIGALLSLRRAGSERALAGAAQCGDWLLSHMRPQERGAGWPAPAAMRAEEPLAGFSHGAAGIAWALLELGAASGEARFRAAALDAIAYERTLFSPAAGNWRDLRVFDGDGRAPGAERYMTAWCHGAPGIGLGRVRALRHLDDAAVRAEIAAALETTRAEGFGHNHSLCHGDLGNLELLLEAGQALGDEGLRRQAYEIAGDILASIAQDGWRCGVPLGVETPGLMTGLAGIGYGLLRLADPLRVPCVLALAPPL